MRVPVTFGSVCSGIEAASVAFDPLGWRASWFSEIEPFPCAVLKHHHPDVPNHGDMTLLVGRILSGKVDAPDLLCGGTPCQAFSVAGHRNSLDDARGNLTLTFVEIADAIDHVRAARGLDPAVVLWENVPGVLSTRDNAFGCFLGALAGSGCELQPPGGRWANAGCVHGPARTVAWRVLDAQYFGLAQRRRRVFVVAGARGSGFDPSAVLFESEGVRRDSAPRRETAAGSADEPAGGVAGSLDTQCGGEKLATQSATNGHLIGTITARMFNALGSRDVEEVALLVVPPAEITGTLAGGGNGHGVPGATGQDAEAGFLVATAVESSRGEWKPGEVASTLRIGGGESTLAFAQNQRNEVRQMEVAGALAAEPGMKQQTYLMQTMAVRRLTPTECERLQGFPDGYTAIPWRGKPASACPDGPRYKAIGNSWAVPCVRWIGARIDRQLVAP